MNIVSIWNQGGVKSSKMYKAMLETMSRPGIFPVLPLRDSAPNLADASFRLPYGVILLIKSVFKY